MKFSTTVLFFSVVSLASAASAGVPESSGAATEAVVGAVLIGLGLIRRSRAQ